MIAAIACCPCTALLVPETGGMATPEMDAVRGACARAVTTMLASGVEAVTVLGPAELSQPLKNLTPGLPLPAFAELPLPAAIAAYLLDRAGWSGPRHYAPVPATGAPIPPLGKAATHTGLLIMGDGSARRGEKAPGYFDPRAEPFDDLVAAALSDGDSGALAELDAALGVELLAAGVGPWKALGALGAVGALNGLWHAELMYSGVPFGVAYFVAAWTPAGG